MSSRKIIGLAEALAGNAVSAARHPVATAGYVVGLAKGVTEATIDAVRGGATTAPSMPEQRASTESTEHQPSAAGHETSAGERTLYGGLNTEAAPPRSPGGGGEPMTHEPRAESRDVEHGEAGVDPREADAWEEEAAESIVDIETPVGTTGADVGFNPDTAESDLQQPDTEPLIDPSTAKAVRSEAETLGRAADPDKG